MSIVEPAKIKIGAKHQLTLPGQVLSKLGLHRGDLLEVRVLEDRIELVPMALIPRDQAWFWTPEWQAMEREADQALASGDYTEHENVEDLLADSKC